MWILIGRKHSVHSTAWGPSVQPAYFSMPPDGYRNGAWKFILRYWQVFYMGGSGAWAIPNVSNRLLDKVLGTEDRSSLVREREYIHKRINNNNTKWRILIPGKWYSKSVEGKGNISLMVLGKLVLLVDFIIIEYSPSPLPYWPLFCQAHLRGRITLLTHGCQCWSYDLHHPIKCEWRRLCHVWGEALIIKVQIDHLSFSAVGMS